MTDFGSGFTDDGIPVDQWRRPLITPPGGGKPLGYTRATTVAGTLDDANGLIKWKAACVAVGLVERDDLLLAVSAHRDDKKELYKICEKAADAGGASEAATKGTALHALTEQYDRGQAPTKIPEDYRADLEAYKVATAPLKVLHIEQRCVVDDLRITGTPDRVVAYQGRRYIADLKTGSIGFPLKIAAQLAIYAHGVPYTHEAADKEFHNQTVRGTWGGVDQDRAIIVHQPIGTGRCELVWVDIAKGWEAVQLAMEVRKWRNARGLTQPFDAVQAELSTVDSLNLDELIATATSVEALTAIWAEHQPTWNQSHTELAAARKALLQGGAAA